MKANFERLEKLSNKPSPYWGSNGAALYFQNIYSELHKSEETLKKIGLREIKTYTMDEKMEMISERFKEYIQVWDEAIDFFKKNYSYPEFVNFIYNNSPDLNVLAEYFELSRLFLDVQDKINVLNNFTQPRKKIEIVDYLGSENQNSIISKYMANEGINIHQEKLIGADYHTLPFDSARLGFQRLIQSLPDDVYIKNPFFLKDFESNFISVSSEREKSIPIDCGKTYFRSKKLNKKFFIFSKLLR